MKRKHLSAAIDWNNRSESFPQTRELVCPVCRLPNVHPIKVGTVNGNDNYEAWEGRGDLMFVEFRCEAEKAHTFRLCFGFHKGTTYAFTEVPA